MADPPGSHIQNRNILQAALDEHLAALRQQHQQQQRQLQEALSRTANSGQTPSSATNNPVATFLAQRQQPSAVYSDASVNGNANAVNVNAIPAGMTLFHSASAANVCCYY